MMPLPVSRVTGNSDAERITQLDTEVCDCLPSVSLSQRHSDTRCDLMCDTAATLMSPAKRAQPITVAHVGNKRSNYTSLHKQRLLDLFTGFWGAQRWPNSIGLAAANTKSMLISSSLL